ncbi:hypothetical protein [Streptomyces salyersiae]|uniref:Integral membrane protein n=1 Tax=Streptomyces salyersiae TaxID=3075530 RepID=A0ABU2RJU8_9ACTN|nr:hypothetical protein [Streptomyces sp. DSM 41770]MDT0428568.1 hypothetical protein [Streptomyces sp. DSM 41770]
MSNDEQQYGQGHGQRYGRGDGQARAYDAQGRPYDAYPASGASAGDGWPLAQGQEPGQPAAPAYPESGQGQAGLGAAQTWQGQTWDTQYQPSIRPRPAPPQEPAPYGAPDQQYGAPGYPAPQEGAPQHAAPQYGAPQHAAPQPTGAPPYADPQGVTSQYPAPQYGAPQHAAPQHTGSQHAAPQHTAPQHAAPQYTGSQHASPQPTGAQPYAAARQAGPQGGSGAYPLPPEAPVAAPAAAPAPAPATAGEGDGYGPATTLGNSRITDAQRARAEGRSPIIAPGVQPAAITAGLGLLLAAGAAIGPYALLVPLVLLQAVTAAGWFRLNGMWPARQGIALAFAGGVVADGVLLVAGRDNGPAAILGTLGVWVLLTLVLQLRSHAGADERMYGLTATVASAALAVLAAGHLAAAGDAVTVGALAVAAAVLVRALPLPGPVSVVVALVAAAGAGAVAGTFTDFGTQAGFLGLAAGVCALIGLRVASYDYPSRFVHMTAGVALPLTAAAPAVYLIGRVLA